ncbi:MAG TPA: helix-turn-helix transcriptional regulator [Lacunisphaera sp.]|nr:helix-turn-helix transcriptional regulator [Lacunisphaera sp.]
MDSTPQAEFARDLTGTLLRLRSGRLRTHVPQPGELRVRRPGAKFHATPELFIQTGGATDFSCPADAFRLGTSDVCVIPRGVAHAEIPQDLRTPYGVLVCMHTRDGLFLHRGRADPAHRIRGYGTTLLPGLRARDSLRYLDEIAAHETVSKAQRRRYVAALLEAFFLTVLSELERPSAVPAADSSPLVIATENLVRTHFPDVTLTVARLARELGCSADHLSRHFHRERGLTLTAWITRERLTTAKEMLADPSYNIAEVGWACGFSGSSYFIRVFSAHNGITPRAYRLNL